MMYRKIQIPKVSSQVNNISQIGIRSLNTVAEFEPVKIGKTSRLDIAMPITFDINYNYYYPLNILALSKSKYDTFIDGDFSAISKQNVILTFDPLDMGTYLDFVRSGGNIVILNTDNDLKGGFSDLLNLRLGNRKSSAL